MPSRRVVHHNRLGRMITLSRTREGRPHQDGHSKNGCDRRVGTRTAVPRGRNTSGSGQCDHNGTAMNGTATARMATARTAMDDAATVGWLRTGQLQHKRSQQGLKWRQAARDARTGRGRQSAAGSGQAGRSGAQDAHTNHGQRSNRGEQEGARDRHEGRRSDSIGREGQSAAGQPRTEWRTAAARAAAAVCKILRSRWQ